MATSPVIETPRLRIEPFAERHLSPRYVSWLNDPAITRYSEQRHRRHTPESCRAYLESFRDTPNHFWALVAGEGGAGHIGNMNAYVETAHGLADVGILIGEASAQGKGYASEAWLGVCDYLLRIAGLRKVTAGTIALNLPMLAVMRKTGMVEDGRRPRHHIWNGQETDVIHAAFFHDDWLRQYPEGPFAKD